MKSEKSFLRTKATLLSCLLIACFSLSSCDGITVIKEDGTDLPEYSTITLGKYPMTLASSDISYKLNHLTSGLPTKLNANGWTKMDDSVYENVYYIDLELNGDMYRGLFVIDVSLYFDQIKNNGYDVLTPYWFKYESVDWFVYKDLEDKNRAVSTKIIDSTSYEKKSIIPSIYKFDYSFQKSNLHAVLENRVRTLLFDDAEMERIKKDQYTSSSVAANMVKQVIVTFEGYLTAPSLYDLSISYPREELRCAEITDYAKALGVSCFTIGERECGTYWLRTRCSNFQWSTTKDGYVHLYPDSICGIRPCFTLI